MNNKLIISFVLIVAVLGGLFFFVRQQSSRSLQQMQPMNEKTQTQAAPNTVDIKNFAFTPEVLTVKMGTTVTWINQDQAVHNIKSAAFNSKDLKKGETFEFTFQTKGTFDYICGIHPSMKGKIVVE